MVSVDDEPADETGKDGEHEAASDGRGGLTHRRVIRDCAVAEPDPLKNTIERRRLSVLSAGAKARGVG